MIKSLRNRLVLISLCCFLSAIGWSQTEAWIFSLRGGPSLYQGDLSGNRFGSIRGKKALWGLGIQRQLDSTWSAGIFVHQGQLQARDSYFPDDPIRSLRNFSFTTSLTDVQLQGFYTLNAGSRLKGRVGTGIGLLLFDPSAYFFDNTILELTDRIKADELADYATRALIIPASLSAQYHFHPQWEIEAGLQLNFAFTDYLDGISAAGEPDNKDHYGLLYLSLNYHLPVVQDVDGDGIADAHDRCPLQPGPESLAGCPDTDGDGITDSEDNCPLAAGDSNLRGCPDSDQDGTPDPYDRCPAVAGPVEAQGCPVLDSDEDGIPDHLDDCPLQNGPADRNGCPRIDSDQDGILDEDDRCPDIFGQALFQGCPDSDGDGIQDDKDACPTVFGVYSEKGCPRLSDPEEEARILSMQVLQFAPNSADLSNFALLDRLYTFLTTHPNYRIRIHGHADPHSDDTADYLSSLRAERVKRYLTDMGVASQQVITEYSGDRRPIASSPANLGQAQNRRVEFFIEK